MSNNDNPQELGYYSMWEIFKMSAILFLMLLLTMVT